jgi:hypothetical protein
VVGLLAGYLAAINTSSASTKALAILVLLYGPYEAVKRIISAVTDDSDFAKGVERFTRFIEFVTAVLAVGYVVGKDTSDHWDGKGLPASIVSLCVVVIVFLAGGHATARWFPEQPATSGTTPRSAQENQQQQAQLSTQATATTNNPAETSEEPTETP